VSESLSCLLAGAIPSAALLLILGSSGTAAPPSGIHAPGNTYFSAQARDPFSQWLESNNAARKEPLPSDELARLRMVLQSLEVPESSQMLVFSATSFQTPLISARNPRAIYFNEDTYIGFVPGGKLEVLSVDPEHGPIFHLLQTVPGSPAFRSERSTRCINCHAPEEKGGIPLLVVESMVPGMSGGGEKSFRTEASGHSIPLSERMGGWHVTGASFAHRGNLLMETKAGVTREIPLPPGRLFSWERYPVETSDALAHLLHEHQLGFINRCVEARDRLATFAGSDRQKELRAQAAALVQYALFADEARLPGNKINSDPAFQGAFLARRVASSKGLSLRDLDLSTHLFKHRCSYMIHSRAFTGLQAALKAEFFNQLRSILLSRDPENSHLPVTERQTIYEILSETMPGLPPDWANRAQR
jgi:hypothetical protein